MATETYWFTSAFIECSDSRVKLLNGGSHLDCGVEEGYPFPEVIEVFLCEVCFRAAHAGGFGALVSTLGLWRAGWRLSRQICSLTSLIYCPTKTKFRAGSRALGLFSARGCWRENLGTCSFDTYGRDTANTCSLLWVGVRDLHISIIVSPFFLIAD